MTQDNFEWKGFTWRNGRHWGLFHPEHNCYCSLEDVHISNDHLLLGVSKRPVVHEGKEYPYSVGYVSTIEPIKYGVLEVEFMLPYGVKLWPAIWLTDIETWPPELDIVEAWSDCGDFLTRLLTRKKYMRHLFVNYIRPCAFKGTNPSNSGMKVFKKLGGTCSRYLDESGLNTCKMEWREDFIKVWYNGHLVMDMRDRDYLEYFNNSNGMEIHLNNYVQGDKTDDCSEPMRPFTILDLKYNVENY